MAVLHALICLKKLQTQVAENADSGGQALNEIKQLENIQSAFKFAPLILQVTRLKQLKSWIRLRDHILALTHNVERKFCHCRRVDCEIARLLEDLESGHRVSWNLVINFSYRTDAESLLPAASCKSQTQRSAFTCFSPRADNI